MEEQQKAFVGNWQGESSENMQDYLKAPLKMGLDEQIVGAALTSHPICEIVVEGEYWMMIYQDELSRRERMFKIGEPVTEISPDGREVECVWAFENGKLKNVETCKTSGKVVHEEVSMDGGKLVWKLEFNGTAGKRFFKKTGEIAMPYD